MTGNKKRQSQSDEFYYNYIEPHLKKITRLSKRGLNKKEIAKRINISPGTFYHHYKLRPELREAFMLGFCQNGDKVARSMVQAALGYHYTETETIKNEFGDVISVKEKKKYQPPNQAAASRVLGSIERYYTGGEWLKEAQIRNLSADVKLKEQAIKALEADNSKGIPLAEILKGLATTDGT